MKRKEPLIFGLALMIVGATALGACAPKQPNNAAENQPSEVSSEKMYPSDWKGQYPHQVASYYSGLKDNRLADPEGQLGHTVLYDVFSSEFPDDYCIQCLACHTSDYQMLLDAYNGDSTTTWDVVWADFPETETWDCYICHGNEPEGEIQTNVPYSEAYTQKDLTDVFGENAVCAQCHMTMINDDIQSVGGSIDVYEKGVDIEAIYDVVSSAAKENPAIGSNRTDEETGLVMYAQNQAWDPEIVEGGSHDTMGVGCVDCHMPTATAEDGTTFTNHDASGSPLQNPDAMNFCLTCHEASHGVKTAEEMVEFVKVRQGNVDARYREIESGIEELRLAYKDALESGTVSEENLSKAADCWSRAWWMSMYEHNTERWNSVGNDGPVSAGSRAAHNYSGMMGHLDRADEYLDAGFEALGVERG